MFKPSPTIVIAAKLRQAMTCVSVYRVVRRQPLPPTPPVLSEFVRMVAELGGDSLGFYSRFSFTFRN